MCEHNFLLSAHTRKKTTRPITSELSVRVAIIMFLVKPEEGKKYNNLKKLIYALLVHALRCNSSGNRLQVLLSLLSSILQESQSMPRWVDLLSKTCLSIVVITISQV